ncbi:MAG: ATP-binding protein [Micromonosporaceae bacterium]
MRLRLVLLVVATSSLVLVAFLIPLAVLLRTVAADRAVSTATVEAQSLAPLVTTLSERDLTTVVGQFNGENSALPVTIYLPDGRTLGRQAPRSAAVDLASRGRSLTAESPSGREVLVAVGGLDGGSAVVRAFVPNSELQRGVTRSWIVLGGVGLGLLALSAIVADQLARSLVRPITAVARASHEMASGDLSVRAEVGGPTEVVQVGTGLNLLGGRIAELLASERETVADMSHRLRTPLTVLRVDTESLTDKEERSMIEADVDALERTVNEIIHEARRPVREGVRAVCEAGQVVRERAAFWSVLAGEQERRMSVDVASFPMPVRVAREDLATCVDTLLENVFAHTPEGVAFAIRLMPRARGGAYVIVADDGPGFADPRLAQRGISRGGSTGLGLDIVRRTAEASGGTLTLARSPSGGAAVIAELGPPVD